MSISNSEDLTPIFLFSLPRSGSTLSMRIIAAHKDVATYYEPCILLPLFYAQRRRHVYAEYNHESTTIRIQDFSKQLPGGVDDYYEQIQQLVLNLYRKVSGPDAKYFLDKTPEYSWIVEDVIRMFPDAKFIFLWRNPLSIVSSLLESWNRGRWNLHLHNAALFRGLANLIAAYAKYADISVSIRYEDMVTNPEAEWARVFQYLGINFDTKQLESFIEITSDARLAGKRDYNRYSKISREPLKKWSNVLSNPFRKAWCRRYLRWIGAGRLALIGYKLDVLLLDLDNVPTTLRYLGSDALRVPFGFLYELFEGQLIKQKIKSLLSGRRIYMHK